MAPHGPTQSTLVFNSAGQAFSIPLHAAHLSQLSQATAATAMYSPDSAQYFQPVTSLSPQANGPKGTRTDRLEVRRIHLIHCFLYKFMSFSWHWIFSFERVSGKWVMFICKSSSQVRPKHLFVCVSISKLLHLHAESASEIKQISRFNINSSQPIE